jgi:hypothetical protein
VTGPNYPHFDAYKALVAKLRSEWLHVPTDAGNPSPGPLWYAIGRCTEEEGDQLGVIGSNNVPGKRWACKTCLGFMEPVWSDGRPLPDTEVLREEWADWMAEGERKVRTF